MSEVTFELSDDPSRSPSFLDQLVDGLAAVIFPSDCSLCHRELTGAVGGGACRECWASLREAAWTGAVCSSCGLPLVSDVNESSAALCSQCRKGEYAFDLARSYGLYTGLLRAAILQLKFHGRERLGDGLGRLLWAGWAALDAALEGRIPVLVPVPLHRSRERERGFNQAAILAHGLAAASSSALGRRDLRVEAGCVKRVRATASQMGLSLAARRENVRGVFGAARPERICGRDVVLVDDVMTTGSTVSACARALKRAGAGHVFVLAAARATPQFPDFTSLP